MCISHKEEEANLTCALNELKDSTFQMIEILNKPIHVDVCHECTKCQTRTIVKNQLLFKKDSIIFRASFVYNLLYEIYNISLDAIKGKACTKDIEQIREEIIKQNINTNMYYIFHGDIVALSHSCCICGHNVFKQTISPSSEPSVDEVDDIVTGFKSISV